eukprot:scaffold190893_cov28-Tisochrysis_lutea.AAC.2
MELWASAAEQGRPGGSNLATASRIHQAAAAPRRRAGHRTQRRRLRTARPSDAPPSLRAAAPRCTRPHDRGQCSDVSRSQRLCSL